HATPSVLLAPCTPTTVPSTAPAPTRAIPPLPTPPPTNLTQTYDGSAKPVTATTSPAGLSGVSITYNGSATVPTNAGSYSVVASLNNALYTAPNATGTLTINKATATLTLSNLTQPYDGSPNPVTATTSPAGLSGV